MHCHNLWSIHELKGIVQYSVPGWEMKWVGVDARCRLYFRHPWEAHTAGQKPPPEIHEEGAELFQRALFASRNRTAEGQVPVRGHHSGIRRSVSSTTSYSAHLKAIFDLRTFVWPAQRAQPKTPCSDLWGWETGPGSEWYRNGWPTRSAWQSPRPTKERKGGSPVGPRGPEDAAGAMTCGMLDELLFQLPSVLSGTFLWRPRKVDSSKPHIAEEIVQLEEGRDPTYRAIQSQLDAHSRRQTASGSQMTGLA